MQRTLNQLLKAAVEEILENFLFIQRTVMTIFMMGFRQYELIGQL
jgi:hypothetical protein